MTVENKVERTMPQKLQPTEISNPKFEKPTEELKLPQRVQPK